ncbi:MAG: 1-phosphofructokinase [Lachnospiraceae bacterium]|nr:1-phosphofructokinase [Lachnospiraceae bacterium]
MIYTVTFNPAIDYLAYVEEMRPGNVNRLQSEEIHCGGKGINVSQVLREFGIPSRALGFVAGFTGKALEEGVAGNGIETDFVHLERGCTRINVKIKSGLETDLNGRGPEVEEKDLARLHEKLEVLQDGDLLVLAGSIPGGLQKDVYGRILERLSGKKIRAVVDAAGELLLNTLKHRPFLIKPNHQELGDLFGLSLSGVDQILTYAGKLKEMGAVNVLVSMAGDGAVLLDEGGRVHRCGACRGRVRNSVGAGDSMVAGFLAGLFTGSPPGDYAYALKLGTAAGGATAFSDGLARREEIEALLAQLS